MGWRRVNNVLHRDVGYLLVGLTLVYGISGVVVNHAADFNPNYREIREQYRFDPVHAEDRREEARLVADRIGLEPPLDAFRPAPGDLLLLYDGWKVEARPAEGVAVSIRRESRPLLHALNRLHLNHLKGAWTWFADVYAVLLVFMAVSGTLVLRGRTGLRGRGKWLILAGLLVPVLALAAGAVRGAS